MSTATRKARKRAGIPFQRTTKIATPLEDRALPIVLDDDGVNSHVSRRAIARLQRRNLDASDA